MVKVSWGNTFKVACTIFCLLTFSCASEETQSAGPDVLSSQGGEESSPQPVPGCKKINGQKTLRIGNVLVEIREPKGMVRGDLLLLPAWNSSRGDWCSRSKACIQARLQGFRIILPEMGKSIYASTYFEETRKDWLEYPTLTWVTDTLISTLQDDYCMLVAGENNYVIGVSAGARGAVRLVQNSKAVFKGAAALSGDYDQTEMKGDNLFRGFYGHFEDFPERWSGEDNPSKNIDKINLPIYFGHGAEDKLVPFTQTQRFYKALRKAHPSTEFTFNLEPGAGHDFDYWSQEVDNVLAFFEQIPAQFPEASN